MKTDVKITSKAQKEVKKIPQNIRESLQVWAETVQEKGLHETSKIKGYNMEKLKGDREGQNSVRLNKSYRAIYTVDKNGDVHIVTIIEVNKHKY